MTIRECYIEPSTEQLVWTITNEMVACRGLIDTAQLKFEQKPVHGCTLARTTCIETSRASNPS
jgi:hypothetical protein